MGNDKFSSNNSNIGNNNCSNIMIPATIYSNAYTNKFFIYQENITKIGIKHDIFFSKI